MNDSSPSPLRQTGAAGSAAVLEEAGFLGDEGRRLFLYSHLPEGPARATVVVCPSIGAEFRRNYAREVLLARALAPQGMAVLRFHYRGTGASDGEPGALALETMIADALSVAEAASARARRIGFLGTRLGATVAAAAAARHPGAPLAVWEPISDPDAFVREIQRSRLVRDLRAGRRASRSLEDEIRSRGKVDVLGYPIGQALLTSLQVVEAPSVGRRPVMLVSLGRRNGPHPRHVALAEGWRGEGAVVELLSLPGYASWWLFDPRELLTEATSGSADLVAPTVEWLAARLGEADR